MREHDEIKQILRNFTNVIGGKSDKGLLTILKQCSNLLLQAKNVLTIDGASLKVYFHLPEITISICLK